MRRTTRSLVVVCLLAAVSLTLGLPAAWGRTARVRLISSEVATGYGDGSFIYAEIPVYLAAYESGIEFRISRDSYSAPIVGEIVTRGRTKPIPAELITDFSGFADAVEIVVTDPDGAEVSSMTVPWCPNSYLRQRVDLSGPDNPAYPQTCGYSPFALGAVWGVESGWATTLSDFTYFEGSGDTYHVTISVSDPVGDLVGIPEGDRSTTVRLDVTHYSEGEVVDDLIVPMSAVGRSQQAALDAPLVSGLNLREAVSASPSAPANVDAVPRRGTPSKSTLPDLIPLPAFWINASHDEDGTDRLNFAANEWNGGPAPLVVEGFRRSDDPNVMDSYQVFYRRGRPVLALPAGTMEFHDDPEHMHWHFLDFTRYDLLDGDGVVVSTSGKQAWCLAPTDPIDLSVRGATFRPESTGLTTSCGGQGALWIRETLPVGWGDTYGQYQTQAFDISELANGTYNLRVTVNPEGTLREVSLDNNVSLREVILGGVPGERTVEVPPFEGIDTEGALIGFEELIAE